MTSEKYSNEFAYGHLKLWPWFEFEWFHSGRKKNQNTHIKLIHGNYFECESVKRKEALQIFLQKLSLLWHCSEVFLHFQLINCKCYVVMDSQCVSHLGVAHQKQILTQIISSK